MTDEKPTLQEVLPNDPSLRISIRKARLATERAKRVRATKHTIIDGSVLKAERGAADLGDCKALYMRYVPITEIVKITGVPLKNLKRAINRRNGWSSQRESMQAEINEAIKQDLLSQIKSVCKTNIELIQIGLERIMEAHRKAETAPDLDEVEVLSKVFERMGRTKSWEEGAKTGREAIKSLTPEEVIQAFATDPYLRVAITTGEGFVALPAPEEKKEGEGFEVPEVKDYEQSRHNSTIQQYTGGPTVLPPG